MTPRQYAVNLAKLADVNVNVALLFDKHVQTLSRRAGLARDKGRRWGCVFCGIVDWIFARFGVKGHCSNSVNAGEIH